jgi:hypothetical protein
MADRIGGSFAPPLTKKEIEEYRKVAENARPQIKGIVNQLADLAELFQQTPRSKKKGTAHPSGTGQIVKLEEEEVKRIDQAVPWDYELEAMQKVLDTIEGRDKELRKAAFHLLWYAKELNLDREPLTNDRL